MTPAYKLFYASPLPVNFDVSTINCLGSWRVERCWLQFPPLSCYMTGVLEIFLQRSTIALLSIGSLMSLTVYIYPHQGIASFHPTSKDSLCGVQGRENGSMHLSHIYCKIKQWIHGDDKSHKLIKIMRICERWMVEMQWNTPFINLSLLYLDIMRTWLYIFFFSFFHGHWCVLFFFFFSSFWVMLLEHAIFFLIAHASFEKY